MYSQSWPKGWSRGERTARKHLINVLEINKELILNFFSLSQHRHPAAHFKLLEKLSFKILDSGFLFSA